MNITYERRPNILELEPQDKKLQLKIKIAVNFFSFVPAGWHTIMAPPRSGSRFSKLIGPEYYFCVKCFKTGLIFFKFISEAKVLKPL